MTTTGGSTTRKSSRESYAVIGTSDFDSAFNEVLSARGYETSNYADVYETCKGGAAIETIRSEVLKIMKFLPVLAQKPFGQLENARFAISLLAEWMFQHP